MKNLSVALVFCLSMVSLFTAVRADALSSARIEKGLSRPEPLSVLPKGDGKGGGGGGGGGGDDKGGGKGGEEDEEEYRAHYSGLSQSAALEMVDPGALDDMLRLRAALRYSR